MSALSHFPVRREELENGLTVLVKEQRASPVAAVLAHVNIGYFNEPDRWNGLSHVIEHMFFKGTERRTSSPVRYRDAFVANFVANFVENGPFRLSLRRSFRCKSLKTGHWDRFYLGDAQSPTA